MPSRNFESWIAAIGWSPPEFQTFIRPCNVSLMWHSMRLSKPHEEFYFVISLMFEKLSMLCFVPKWQVPTQQKARKFYFVIHLGIMCIQFTMAKIELSKWIIISNSIFQPPGEFRSISVGGRLFLSFLEKTLICLNFNGFIQNFQV